METLPVEVREQILLHLPLDSIKPIVFASKYLLSPFLLHSPVFAQRHIRVHLTSTPIISLKDHLKSLNYNNLPKNCASIVYTEFLSKENAPETLQFAASHGFTAFVRHFLTTTNVDPAADNSTVLYGAAVAGHIEIHLEEGHIDIVKIFMQDPRTDWEDSHCPDLGYDLPLLMVAIQSGSIDIMKLILARDDLDHYDWYLEEAAKEGRVEAVKLLLADRRGALKEEQYAVVGLLLADERVDVHEMIVTFDLWYELFAYGWTSGVKQFFMEPKDEGSFDGNQQEETEIVELLLKDDRVDPTAYENSAILAAIDSKHYTIVNLLLRDDRVDPLAFFDQISYNLSMNSAAEYGCLEKVKRNA
ncbi:UNVERIFIED_CONTAM: hypothetical protein HDU68_011502 [Siphonaria sp. JEL0065]|nr:hypothetical protein HDU68_011502 [Siphonaria sp. JEL0065]